MPAKNGVNLWDRLQNVAKVAGVFTLAFYLLGFLVVNMYLRQFSYYTVDLLKAQYLTAGIWALVPILVGWFFFSRFIEDPAAMSKRKFLSVLIFGGLGWIGSVFLLFYFSEWLAGLPLIYRWFLLSIVAFFISLCVVGLVWSINSLRGRGASLHSERVNVGSSVFLLVVTIFAIWLYLWNFSRSLYGDIPATLGGGRPRLVRLVVKGEAREELIAAGVSFSEGLRTSEPIKLLVATDKEYVFLTGTPGSSFSVRSDSVQSILYEGR